MAALSDEKIQIVRALVEQAPDPVVARLQAALAQAGGDDALASVRQLVDLEADDRRVRNSVLAPIAAMCLGDGRSTDRIRFPKSVLGLLWCGLKRAAPAEVADARGVLRELAGCEHSREAFDRLTRVAAEGVRERQGRDFTAAAEAAAKARENGAGLLAACLDISPVVRLACQRLPEWMNRTDQEVVAQARVAFKDAVTTRTDAAPLFFEMLAAQLAHPWQVLRIISAVMDKPDEHYFAASESALFALRLMDQVDAEMRTVAAIDADGGRDAGRAAAKVVERITEQIGEISAAMRLDREGGWGRRVAQQRAALASTVEARLRELERAIGAALPTRQEKVARRMKAVPKVSQAPDAEAVGRAMTLLQFASDIRGCAGAGGFASSRAKMLEALAETVDTYVEDLLDRLRHGEVEDAAAARAYLEVAAEFAGLIHDPKAAQVVRRRASAV
ncbi:hypothetical protein [Phenylobacterium sp.]|jgi:hypothetical protein|uniref:hypothetical protein n=1 Tax=Phenylobacterium sp. TaxID=1871053 RepID=UPI002E349EA8|nr:hypothetical protein [Phenylobacterium sp.]HEX2561862.1 hypothetical protein [Phenylobacterium sp.]